jgi:hypothetical protein
MRLDLGVLPGVGELGRRRQRGEAFPGFATEPIPPLTGALGEGGPAWGDSLFVDELLRANLAAGAGPATGQSIQSLREGAPLVITGQQPGLLAGPLYCLWKIWGAIALARSLSTASSAPVIPVYWCGADDSDFEEARRTWIVDRHGDPLRGELPPELHGDGRQVGYLPGSDVASLERSLVRRLRPGWGRARLQEKLDSIPDRLDFGARMGAWWHRLLPDSGLVVVDARAARLIEMGRPLFERYARCRARAEALVRDRSQQMLRAGLAPPLAESAIASGLFRVEDGRRRKLDAAELSRAMDATAAISASVLLRPLWQDQLLGPSIAVLGPAEQSYHVQIAPLYELLEVRAAAAVPRPHAVLVPSHLPWPESSSQQSALLGGGEDAVRVLRDMALPGLVAERVDQFASDQGRALDELRRRLGLPQEDPALRLFGGRVDAAVRSLREEMARRALERPEGRRWRRAAAVLRIGSTPQERALASITLWSWWAEGAPSRLDELGAAYVRALEQAWPPEWILYGERP